MPLEYRLPIRESVYNHTCECLARHDRVEKPPRTSGNPLGRRGIFVKFRGPTAHPNRPRKTMVCPTFSTKCTDSRGGLTIRRRLNNLPHKAALPLPDPKDLVLSFPGDMGPGRDGPGHRQLVRETCPRTEESPIGLYTCALYTCAEYISRSRLRPLPGSCQDANYHAIRLH
jgi:hypothetical protein